MTTIATLPAGRYALSSTHDGFRRVIANPADVTNRSMPALTFCMPCEDGPFETVDGLAARITLHGAEAQYRHAEMVSFLVQTPRGTLSCSKVMAIIPVDTLEGDRVSGSGSGWHAFESTEAFDVTYADGVLRAADQVVDINAAQTFCAQFDEMIAPADEVYALVGCDKLDKGHAMNRIRLRKAQLEKLGGLDTPAAKAVLAHVARFDGIVILSPAHVPLAANDDAPRHLTDYGAPCVIRVGSAVHDLLSPESVEHGCIGVHNIDRAMVDRLLAIGGPEAEMAAGVVASTLDLKQDVAWFRVWVEPLEQAA